MTYVYRDPTRVRTVPVPPPSPEPAQLEPTQPEPTPIRKDLRARKYAKIRTIKPNPPAPMPEPLWGGRLGLELAHAEIIDWEHRNPHFHHRPKS